ncbi:hypothetical protein RR46_12793 [Papilio xuthus]|uniref:Uncharacterized protein n=1 Tax=Papilio xuthus TaxID=66420 RepID=A0A194PKU9_PAPXU|nr:hypothetical protein RR46_12793 [Papilio xuthus]
MKRCVVFPRARLGCGRGGAARAQGATARRRSPLSVTTVSRAEPVAYLGAAENNGDTEIASTRAMATALVVLLAVAAAASPAPSAPPLDVTTLLEDMTYEVTMTTLLPENDTVVEISTIAADDNIGSTSVSQAGQRGDGEWRCPRGCECAALAEGTSYNCSLPSGVLAFDEYGDGITFKCQVRSVTAISRSLASPSSLGSACNCIAECSGARSCL